MKMWYDEVMWKFNEYVTRLATWSWVQWLFITWLHNHSGPAVEIHKVWHYTRHASQALSHLRQPQNQQK